MATYCRLCAQIKEEREIKTSIYCNVLNIQQKLIDCCRWRSFEEKPNFPQSICVVCFDQLENSWTFADRVHKAQIELETIFSHQNASVFVKQEQEEFHDNDLSNDIVGDDDK